MAQLFDLINDIALSYDGDIIVDENNDTRIINGIDWFKREVNKLVRTNLRDWRAEPDIGLDLEDHIGKINNRENAEELREKVLEAITVDSFQFPGEFEVRVVPTSVDSLTIYITYNIIGERINISKLIFNLNKGLSVAIPDELEVSEERKLPSRQKREIKNVYLNSIKG